MWRCSMRNGCLAGFTVIGLVMAAVLTLGPAPVVSAQGGGGSRVSPLAGVAGTMRAEVAIRHRRIGADGRDGRVTLPPVSLRLDRRIDGGRWKTTLQFQTAARPTARVAGTLIPLDNPFAISRVEFDDEGGEPKVFDQQGRRVAMAGEAERRRFGMTPERRGPGWDPRIWVSGAASQPGRGMRGLSGGGFFAEARQRESRRAELVQRFGRSLGRLRGFDRFVRTEGRETQELLVHPDAALPVEVNTLTDNVLSARAELRYDATTTGHVRQFLRAEQALPDASRERVVTEVELSNVAVATGGGL